MAGAGEVQNNIFAQGKINWKKNYARQLTLKNIHATPKKIHTRNLITKKHYCGSKIPTPTPHNFSNGKSLRSLQLGVLRDVTWYVLVIFNHMPVRSSYDHCRIGSSRKYNSFLLVKNYANLPVINSNHITKYIKKRIFNYMLYILSNLQLNFPVKFQLITPDTWL